MNMIQRGVNFIFNRLAKVGCQQILAREHFAQEYSPNERVVEYRFVFDSLFKCSPKTVIDVGTGLTSLPHLMATCGFVVTATDNIEDYWPSGMFNRHFHLVNDDIMKTRVEGRFDFATCISTLEHIEDHQAAVKSMIKLLNPGGHLALSFPYNENRYVPNAYKEPGSHVGAHIPYIAQVFSRKQIDQWCNANGARVVAQEYWQCYTGDLWTLGTQIYPPVAAEKTGKHHLSCLLLQKL